jgi:hypothetical protein
VAAVRERIAASPELTERFEREVEALDALRALRSDRAPARLRMSVGKRPEPARRPRFRLAYGGTLAGAVAAVVAALVLLLPGGGPGGLSVADAAALALKGPAMGPPMPDNSQAGHKLGQDVGEVYFPNWSRLHWTAVGQRVDRPGHRLAITVYYKAQNRWVAYTILDGPALRWPGTTRSSLHGVQLQSFTSGKRTIVTWRRAGHTCVLSGVGVPASVLARLAVSD